MPDRAAMCNGPGIVLMERANFAPLQTQNYRANQFQIVTERGRFRYKEIVEFDQVWFYGSDTGVCR